MKNLSSVVASIVLILIAIHELRYLRKVVIKEKKSKSEIFVTIIAFIVISIITYFYAKCFWDYLMFATGLLCLVADVWKQGLSEDGVLIVARGKELYKWTEIHHIDILISDIIKVVYFEKQDSEIDKQCYPISSSEKIITLLQKHNVSYKVLQ